MSCEDQLACGLMPTPEPASAHLTPPELVIGARLRDDLARRGTPFVCVDVAQASS